MSFSPDDVLSVLQSDNQPKLIQLMSNGLDPNFSLPKLPYIKDTMLLNDPPIICVAGFYGSIECLKLLLVSGALLESKDKNNIPLSNFVVAGGKVELAQVLLGYGITFDQLISIAASYGRENIFFWVLSNNQNDLTQVFSDQSTLLHLACSGGSCDIVRYLVEHENIDYNVTNDVLV